MKTLVKIRYPDYIKVKEHFEKESQPDFDDTFQIEVEMIELNDVEHLQKLYEGHPYRFSPQSKTILDFLFESDNGRQPKEGLIDRMGLGEGDDNAVNAAIHKVRIEWAILAIVHEELYTGSVNSDKGKRIDKYVYLKRVRTSEIKETMDKAKEVLAEREAKKKAKSRITKKK